MTEPEQHYVEIGAFARRAGVTVRTVRYYDSIGLLAPSGFSPAGRRLYGDRDYTRLQQVLTLKLIGLSLAQIKTLLTDSRRESTEWLAQQKRVLQQKARQIAVIIESIERAQQAAAAGTLDLDQVITIIKAVNMSLQADWLHQFVTPDQAEALARRSEHRSLDEHRQVAEAWRRLFRDIHASLALDLTSEAVQQLVQRWDALISTDAADDDDLAERLGQVYGQLPELLDRSGMTQPVSAWAETLREAADFIERARRTDRS